MLGLVYYVRWKNKFSSVSTKHYWNITFDRFIIFWDIYRNDERCTVIFLSHQKDLFCHSSKCFLLVKISVQLNNCQRYDLVSLVYFFRHTSLSPFMFKASFPCMSSDCLLKDNFTYLFLGDYFWIVWLLLIDGQGTLLLNY